MNTKISSVKNPKVDVDPFGPPLLASTNRIAPPPKSAPPLALPPPPQPLQTSTKIERSKTSLLRTPKKSKPKKHFKSPKRKGENHLTATSNQNLGKSDEVIDENFYSNDGFESDEDLDLLP